MMLERAMLRLKIPPLFIELICSLFKSRKNCIITPDGLSDSYDVLVGIDQGEVISPLLWVIYYDPLFCRLKNLQQKYSVSVNRLVSIDLLQYEQLKVKC